MVNKEIKFDFDDLLIMPCSRSKINSRKEVNVFDENGMLPIFTAPMDTVIDENNKMTFGNNKIYTIIPRTYDRPPENDQWKAIGLKEFEHFYITNKIWDLFYVDPDKAKEHLNHKILIDIANGHMSVILDLVKKAKKIYGDKLTIMVGNVANPQTFFNLSEAGADYIRVGIGNGGGCLTSQNVGVGYPLASLLFDINSWKKIGTKTKFSKVVADGGMKNYSDIIKSLALGADYVMVGSIFNKALESAGETYGANIHHESWLEPGELVDQYSDSVMTAFKNGAKFYKKFRGMSTKGVQKLLGNNNITTSEGVTRMNPVEYTVEGWTENFKHYLASAMSYTGSSNLKEFIGHVDLNLITPSSFNRFNK